MSSLTKSVKNKSTGFIYYIARIVQRWSLLSLVGLTLIYWAVQITEAVNIRFLSAAGTKLGDTEAKQLNHDLDRINTLLGQGLIRWAVFATIVTFGFLGFINVRKQEKRLVADSLVVIVFCILSATMSQVVIRSFIDSL